ncbi:transcriptional regulator [Paenibacillus aceti]|uniref:Transcriptional regulator n=2 Tax=Paenibacillus aceti TaxID=1820010 RepID=A0ABQ1VZ01_9BACL|nr:MarR family transcriptional regulator [Paenibacillus aceti]GGG06384.1 transcriptional regulator [Paenibacillus aceti]
MTNNSRHDLPPSMGSAMGVTYRKLAMYMQHHLKQYDITPEQLTVLLGIGDSEGLIQKEIAQRARKDHPTTTRILDQLEGKGLIRKQQGERDRRSFLVFSTDKAKEVAEAGRLHEEDLKNEILECISAEEYDMLMELLNRIGEHFSEVNKE